MGTGHEGVELEDRALRYRTLCILTDVDVDRSCIRVMLLIFFFLHQMELMTKRYLYIAQLPLCKFVMGSGRARTEKYTFWEEEYEEYLREILGIDVGGYHHGSGFIEEEGVDSKIQRAR